eukprot:6206829-Pleurochrysis_carterae.AAC.1
MAKTHLNGMPGVGSRARPWCPKKTWRKDQAPQRRPSQPCAVKPPLPIRAAQAESQPLAPRPSACDTQPQREAECSHAYASQASCPE